MAIIKPLPSWALINRFPAFYDHESLTAVEQTARVYAKINELIESYNKYVEEINAELMAFEQEHDKDFCGFTKTIINLTDKFISTVNMSLDHQNRKLDEFYKQFTSELNSTITLFVEQMKESGELDEAVLTALDGVNTKLNELETFTTSLSARVMTNSTDIDALAQRFNTASDIVYSGGKTLWEGTDFNNGFGGATATQVPDVGKYRAIGMKMKRGGYCVCDVVNNGSTYTATGGYVYNGESLADNQTASLTFGGYMIGFTANGTVAVYSRQSINLVSLPDLTSPLCTCGVDDDNVPVRIDGLVRRN